MSQSNLGESKFDPDTEYLTKAYRPKQKVRDEQDMKYKEKMQAEKKRKEKTGEQSIHDFTPDQDLQMEKERYKREKLFAKQVGTIVKVNVHSAQYYMEPNENQLKWNLKEYRKYGKKNQSESAHMKMAGISFAKKNQQVSSQTNIDGNESQVNQEQQQDDDVQPSVYVELQYGQKKYKSEFKETQNTENENGQMNPYEFKVDWSQPEFEWNKTTETIVYFTLKVKDIDEKYKQRYPWLKAKYEGDPIIGKAKLDLASLVTIKENEEKREKEVKIKREDNQEVIGTLNIDVAYKKAEYERVEAEKLKYNFQVSNFSADFSKADISKIEEKIKGASQDFGGLVPYAKIRICQQVKKTDYGSGQSVSASEDFNFNVGPEVKKLYVEVHMYNEISKFNECVGIGVYPFNKLDQFSQTTSTNADKMLKNDIEIPLSYKGKVAGNCKLTVTQYKQLKTVYKKVRPEPKDIKEISKPSELDIKRKKVLEMRSEMNKQRFHELNFQKLDPEQNVLTPQPKIKKIDKGELVLPQIKQTQSSVLNKKTFMGDERERLIDRDPIKIQMVQNQAYHQQIMGTGFSSWESSSTLQRSVPHFSIPRQPRFNYDSSSTPAPNKYSSVGVLENMAKMDAKLQKKRQKDFQDYQRYKREMAK